MPLLTVLSDLTALIFSILYSKEETYVSWLFGGSLEVVNEVPITVPYFGAQPLVATVVCFS